MATAARVEQLRRLAEIRAKSQGTGRQARAAQSQLDQPTDIFEGRGNPLVRTAQEQMVQEMSGPERFLAGAGKTMSDTGQGLMQLLESMPHPELGDGNYRDEFKDIQDARKEKIAITRERDEPLMDTGAGTAGGLVGAIAAAAPAAMIPGANTVVGSTALGAALGATQPRTEEDSLLTNTLMGGGGGLAGGGLAKTLGRVLNPQTAPAVKELLDADVPLTPGQILGGSGRRVEEALKSVPFVGQSVRDAEVAANQGFNNMVLNKVLEPVGRTVTGSGREGLKETRRLIGDHYDEALSSLNRVDMDKDFSAGITQVREMARTLPEKQSKQLDNILNTRIYEKLTPAGSVSGDSFKQISSSIKTLARGYTKSADFEDRQLGDALSAVNEELKKLASRTDPVAAAAVEKSDKAFAMLLRAENAGGRQGAEEGVFSPSLLKSASRQLDPSLRKIDTTQGNALLEDIAEKGKKVLGSKMPDSGTSERLTTGAMLTGGAGVLDPVTTIGTILAGKAAYTPAGRKALEVLLARRFDPIRSMGRGADRLSPWSAALASEKMTGE